MIVWWLRHRRRGLRTPGTPHLDTRQHTESRETCRTLRSTSAHRVLGGRGNGTGFSPHSSGQPSHHDVRSRAPGTTAQFSTGTDNAYVRWPPRRRAPGPPSVVFQKDGPVVTHDRLEHQPARTRRAHDDDRMPADERTRPRRANFVIARASRSDAARRSRSQTRAAAQQPEEPSTKPGRCRRLPAGWRQGRRSANRCSISPQASVPARRYRASLRAASRPTTTRRPRSRRRPRGPDSRAGPTRSVHGRGQGVRAPRCAGRRQSWPRRHRTRAFGADVGRQGSGQSCPVELVLQTGAAPVVVAQLGDERVDCFPSPTMAALTAWR